MAEKLAGKKVWPKVEKLVQNWAAQRAGQLGSSTENKTVVKWVDSLAESWAECLDVHWVDSTVGRLAVSMVGLSVFSKGGSTIQKLADLWGPEMATRLAWWWELLLEKQKAGRKT